MDEAFADTSFGRLRLLVGGSGRDLLAIVPVGAEWMEAALPPSLLERFRVHVLDIPGTGRSEGEATTVHAVTSAVGEAVAVLELDDTILFGHSMNGTLALAAATTVPCSGVIAVGAVPTLPPDSELSAMFWEEKAEPGRKAAAAAAEAAFDSVTSDEAKLAAWQAYNNVRRWYDVAVDRSDLDTTGNLPQGWIQAVFEDGSTQNWPSVFASVECPVFLALGDYDFIAPPTAWTPENLPPKTTVERFSRSAHTPFVEQPEKFVAAVDRWLGLIPSRSGRR